jgi:hypothetical protein
MTSIKESIARHPITQEQITGYVRAQHASGGRRLGLRAKTAITRRERRGLPPRLPPHDDQKCNPRHGISHRKHIHYIISAQTGTSGRNTDYEISNIRDNYVVLSRNYPRGPR